jgi:hypothetical protein
MRIFAFIHPVVTNLLFALLQTTAQWTRVIILFCQKKLFYSSCASQSYSTFRSPHYILITCNTEHVFTFRSETDTATWPEEKYFITEMKMRLVRYRLNLMQRNPLKPKLV